MIGIITLPNFMYYNYGGILQNYALCYYLNKKGYDVRSIHCNASTKLGSARMFAFDKFNIKVLKETGKWKIEKVDILSRQRNKNFEYFIDENIDPIKYSWYSQKTFAAINRQCEAVIIGSDQVWNPHWINEKTYKTFLLTFLPGEKRISYAASFGVSTMQDESTEKFRKALMDYKAISVREDAGADIVRTLTGKAPDVLVDPTLLLTSDEWSAVAKKSNRQEGKRYLLKYFLGEQSDKCRQEIARVAKKYSLEIYELADKNCQRFYTAGPAEFLDLFANATLVYSDSFHATVFSVIYGKPFVILNRIQNGMSNMGSRIQTLLSKTGLESRMPGMVTEETLFDCNYNKAYKRLLEERNRADAFIIKELGKQV